MPSSSRFAVATHILTLLAVRGDEPTSSEMIASSVSTNPVVIRRLLSILSRSGLVHAVSGRHGGALLARDPREITLYDVYRAVEERNLISLHAASDTKCPVGRKIHGVLESYCGRAEEAMSKYLRGVTLDQVVSETEAVVLI
ncbi:MAG TPA: Rrf2 family transcriptional regulator [Thermoanaerobaculia bacterium]|nr:Rrf2 family transcriptional regulator [Thermoanaerobaculia bacterium]